MKTIDARGRSCPQPVIMTKQAIDEGVAEIEILVDNQVASGNVKRLLEKKGYSTKVNEQGDQITVKGNRVDSFSEQSENKPRNAAIDSTTILITRDIIGGNDQELGEVLVKAFLGTLAQMPSIPKYISLMNEGIKLALQGTSSCDYLKELEENGSQILVCGTCTNHFGVTEKIGVGIISNMFDITESILNVTKVISI